MFSANQPHAWSALSQLSSLYIAARAATQSVLFKPPQSTKPCPMHHVKERAASVHHYSSQDQSAVAFASDLTMEMLMKAASDLLPAGYVSCLSDLQKELCHIANLSANINTCTGCAMNHCTESHVSAESFFENRTGFSKRLLHDSSFSTFTKSPLLSATCHSTLQSCINQIVLQQVRGFKTDRTGKTGLGKTTGRKSQSVLDDLRKSVYARLFPEMKQSSKTSDKVRRMLNDDNHTPEMQDKIKLAFAEGYVANDTTRASDQKNSVMSRFVRVFFFVMFVWLAVQFFQIFSAVGGAGVRGLGMLSREQHEVNPENITVSFDDVRGCEEAKQELKDVVEFLKDPDKFTSLGAKLPKGVLLVGPPGIGKTLLARAVAGEAEVPFFHVSGSEFDEIFVGTGAKRVRQLFAAAKLRAPCVIFIDEIDTVGAKRTSSQIHPYANQTINQLLSEMDGFQQNEGVIVLGATNRMDHLDKALLRPGRFDVEVRVFPPDLKGRMEIIEYYLSKVKQEPNIDVDKLARGTTGFTGADIENMVNQAALKAAMDIADNVSMAHLEFARDKVLMGPAKKSRIPDEDTNWITAYHEAGHTIVSHFTKDATPLNKVTIIPRGMSLGHTSFIADKEIYNLTRSQLLAEMDVSMGGRVAEEVIYGLDMVTTGASSDFKTATGIASAMVKQMGMSEKVGVRVFNDGDPSDSGLSLVKVNEVSPAIQEQIDMEIRRILQESYDRAKSLLKQHAVQHKALAKALMKYETLDSDDVKAIIEGKQLVKS